MPSLRVLSNMLDVLEYELKTVKSDRQKRMKHTMLKVALGKIGITVGKNLFGTLPHNV